MNNIKKILREELERQIYLTESYSTLDKDNLQEEYFNVTVKMLQEGYSLDEIEQVSEGIFGNQFLDSLLGGVNFGNLGSGFWSGVKEQIIRLLLTKLGIGGGVANIASTVLADIDVRDMLKPFKSPELCTAKMPGITNVVVEAIIRYLQFGEKTPNLSLKKGQAGDLVKLGIGEYVGEVIKDSNLGETIAGKLCNSIWRIKQVPATDNDPQPAI
jgi:hypothetical protein